MNTSSSPDDIASETSQPPTKPSVSAKVDRASTPVRKEGRKKPKLIINILNTQYSVVREVAKKEFRFKASLNAGSEWDLFWADTGVTADLLTKMKPYQKVNHYPAMGCLAKKNYLGRNLMRMRKNFPVEYNFFPPTWSLPRDANEFRLQFEQGKCKMYIAKPEALCQGRGIFLFRSPDELDPNEHYVVQRYIKSPYLIDDLKFDLRIYVLVYGCDPLRIYIYNEGLARLATEEYEVPCKGNMKNLFIHLTNYAINKDSENFVFNTDSERTDVGHKRSLSFVWSYIDSHGGNSKLLKRKIRKSIVKTLCAVQPHLSHSYRMCQPNDFEDSMCFEILGFDILIDHKLKPWLLEVNHSPSFTTDTPFDYKVKRALIADTIRLLHMNSNNRVKYYQQKQEETNSRVLGRGQSKATKEEKEELHRKALEERDKYELAHLGNYVRAYPDPKLNDKYGQYIAVATKAWEEFYGYNKRGARANERNGLKTNDKNSGKTGTLMKTVGKKSSALPNVKPSHRKFTPEKYNRAKRVNSNTYSRESRDKSTSILRPEDWPDVGGRKAESEIPRTQATNAAETRDRPRPVDEISQAKFRPIENSNTALEVFGRRVAGSLPKPHTKITMQINSNNEMKGCFRYVLV